jgi:hypothetical protein
MNDPNAWKRGMERISPGIYVDAGNAMHIDSREMLEHYGCAPTLQNEAILCAAAQAVFQGEGIKFTDVDEMRKTK